MTQLRWWMFGFTSGSFCAAFIEDAVNGFSNWDPHPLSSMFLFGAAAVFQGAIAIGMNGDLTDDRHRTAADLVEAIHSEDLDAARERRRDDGRE